MSEPTQRRTPIAVAMHEYGAIALVLAEIDAAHAKWGKSIESPDVSDDRRGAILAEEAGEVAKALNEIDIVIRTSGAKTSRREVRENLRAELAQVAATAIRWLTIVEREPRPCPLTDAEPATSSGKIEVATKNGKRTVAAYITGQWAAHRWVTDDGEIDRLGRWSVSHVVSGLCVPGVELDERAATALAERLGREIEPFDVRTDGRKPIDAAITDRIVAIVREMTR